MQAFLANSCQPADAESFLVREARREQTSQLDGEYLTWEEILHKVGDETKAEALIKRRRSEVEGTTLDQNDGTTERFWFATKHATTAKSIVIESASTSSKQGQASAAHLGLMTSLSTGLFDEGDAGSQQAKPVEKQAAKKIVKKETLSIEAGLSKNPSAYAAMWRQAIIADLGKAREFSIRLAGMECQEDLRRRLDLSAGVIEDIYKEVAVLGENPDALRLQDILERRGKPAACGSKPLGLVVTRATLELCADVCLNSVCRQRFNYVQTVCAR